MRIILERHAYAPELNTAYVGPTRTAIRAPGCTSIAQVRAKLFTPLKYKGRFVILRAVNVPEHSSCNRTISGYCITLESLAGALRVFRKRHNLPGCEHRIETKLIG